MAIPMTWWRGRRQRAAASVSTVTVFSTALAVLAFTNPGYMAADVELNDAGVWVTRQGPAAVGRFNHEARVLDGLLMMTAEDFDVLQQEDTVLLHDVSNATLSTVDPATVEMTSATNLPPDHQVGLGGNAVAILDRSAGLLWVLPADGVASFSPDSTEPVAEDLTGGELAVGPDGTVHVATAHNATLTSVPTDQAGRPLEPVTRELTDVGPDDSLRVTAVGEEPVVLDRDRAELILPDDRVEVEDAEAALLQEPGESGSAVVYATSRGLVSQPLDGGAPTLIDATSGATPTVPVVARGCAYGAWAGDGVVVRDCPGEGDDLVRTLENLPPTAELRYRTNRGAVVLNDPFSGSVWLAQEAFELFQNWEEVLPSESASEEEESTSTEVSRDPLLDRNLPNRPPIAKDDEFGVRPGRTTILPILDNDSDPDGDVLTAALTGADPGLGRLDLIHGGKGMQVTVNPDATGAVAYDYEASDGRAGTDTATVRLVVRGADENGLPRMKDGRETVAVVEQGKSVAIDVLADWTDPDGDPLLLLDAAASTPDDEVRFRPDGVVTFQDAGKSQGRKAVTLSVSDSRGEPVEGTLWVDVRPAGSLIPDARADHATTVVGRSVVIEPLLNDFDPNGDVLRLAHAEPRADATITPDYAAGTITFTAEAPGSYDFTYLVTDGPNAVLGLVRVDVLPVQSGDVAPIAVRDRALLPAGGSVLVAVLANDTDPAAGVLVVQSVQVPPNSPVSVAVVNHEILRITSTRTLLLGETLTIGYTVSNGLASANGEVVVVPLPAPEQVLPPTAVEDDVSVRVGDVVTIPVLANDTHPTDAPLTLVRDLAQVPDPAAGLIFTTADSVRFQAGTEPQTVYALYEVRAGDSEPDSAQITIHIRAQDAERNAAPRPRDVTARVLAGTTTRIAIPLDGIDPDGDSVNLVGLDTPPAKGRVTAFGEGWMEYTAGDTTTGLDEFRYTVRDTLGAVATATVHVGIAPPPSTNQAPIALDDQVVARPDRLLSVPVLLNDVDPEGSQLQLGGTVESEELDATGEKDRVLLRTPVEPGTYTARYTVLDGYRATASALVLVTVTPEAPLQSPIARDDALTLADVVGRTAVDVPVLENDDDPDGSTADLTVSISSPNARVLPDGQVRVTLTESTQILPYTITDLDERSAIAFIRVPGAADLRPSLREFEPFEVKSGESIEVDLTDVVQVRDGLTPRVTQDDRVWAVNGTEELLDSDTIRFTAAADRHGPAALSFEVTDGQGPDDPEGMTAVLTVPITVLPPDNQPPAFTGLEVQVPQGEEVSTDLVPFATDPDPADQPNLRFAVAGDVPDGFSARVDGTNLVVGAESGVELGTSVRIALEVTDGATDPVGAEAVVTVASSNAPLATVTDEVVPDANQGETETIDVLANDVSPFPGKPLTLVSAAVESGVSAGAPSIQGSSISVTPGPDFVGTLVVRYRVADDTGDPSREVDGRIRLTVRGKPGAPLTPTVAEVRSRTVVLTWAPPVNNGAPIQKYTVSSPQGFSQDCGATTCTLTGLTNNVEYTFAVVATNEVGDSAPSPQSGPARPDERPDMPQPPTLTFGDRSLTVRWVNQSYSDRSPIESVTLEISPAPPGGAIQRTGVAGSEIVWDGLENGTAYQVRVQAVNRAPEPSDWSGYSASEIPAGPPDAPGAPTTAMLPPVGAQAQMNVTWGAPFANGDAIAAYELAVLRGGAVVRTLEVPGGQTSQAVVVDTSETNYTYSVRARNKAGFGATSAQSAPRRAVVPPGPVTGLTAAPLDNAIQLTFGAAAGNGATASEIRYQYSVNGGAWNSLAADKVIRSGVPNNGTYTASVRAVSTVDGAQYAGPATAANAVAPYGPPGTPGVSATAGSTTVHVCWSPPARNGLDFRVETNIDNAGWVNRGTSGCADVGNGYSQSHSIQARTVDSLGRISPTASAQATTPPPPAPSAYVQKVNGQPYVYVSNFWPGTHVVRCWNDAQDGYSWTNFIGETTQDSPANGYFIAGCGGQPIPSGEFSVEIVGLYWTSAINW